MQQKMFIGNADLFVEHCKKFALKITPQRCAVYKYLIQSKIHPTAEEIHSSLKAEFPNVSYDTVNRTLMTFAEIGLVEIVQNKGGARRFDHVMDNHHHFNCMTCGRIIDFQNDAYDELDIPERIRNDCTVFVKRVVLSGLCQACRDQKKESKN